VQLLDFRDALYYIFFKFFVCLENATCSNEYTDLFIYLFIYVFIYLFIVITEILNISVIQWLLLKNLQKILITVPSVGRRWKQPENYHVLICFTSR